MRQQSLRHWAGVAGLATLIVAGPALLGAPASAAPWAHVRAGAPVAALHLRGKVFDPKGQPHSLELWREAGGAVRRDSDAQLTTVVRIDAQGELHATVIDRPRGHVFKASRQSLLRLGRFTGWFELALLVPASAQGAPVRKGQAARMAGQACQLYEVAVQPALRLCWSRALQTVLSGETLREGRWTALMTIEQAERLGPDSTLPLPDTKGLAELDLDAELTPSGD